MEHTSQGRGSTGSHMEHTYQGFGQTSQGFHSTHPSTFQHSQTGEGFWGGTYGSGSSFQTPDRGFQPSMSHDTSGSRYASPVICEHDDGDDEEPHDEG
ncbi:hypothetical protein AgCh_037973 [Apium graveolens]